MHICLTTERLTLRPIRRSDAGRITELIGNYDVSKMLSRVPHPYCLKDANIWIDGLSTSGSAEPFTFAIDQGQGLIGVVGFLERGDEPEIGYWLGEPYWGGGLMSEAARAAVEWRFAATGCQRIVSGAFRVNQGSQRILQKLGFKITGTNMINCRSRDTLMPHISLALSRQDFASLSGRPNIHTATETVDAPSPFANPEWGADR